MNSTSVATGTVPLDYDLALRAREGDADAFAVLFHAHKSRIYSVILRMTNNAAEAEDLTQDAFLLVFRKIGMFRGDSAFGTWVHRIAVNTVLMHFRKKSLRQVSLDEPCLNSDGAGIRRQFGVRDKRLAGCADRLALIRAIKELPHGYRTVYLLHEVHGYEHQEIAEMLACSVGNSKSQLHKARLRIREWLTHSPETRSEEAPIKSASKCARQASEKRFLPIGQDVIDVATFEHTQIGTTDLGATRVSFREQGGGNI